MPSAAAIDRAAHRLLGRHVADLALELTGIRAAIDERRQKNSEVAELHFAGATDEHVAGRHVAMHDAERAPLLVVRTVSEVERAQHFVRDEQRDRYRKAAARGGYRTKQARERHAVHVLECHEHFAIALAEVHHLNDVRMRQSGTDPRLVAEHRYEARVACELWQDALDGKALVEAVRTGTRRNENLRHSTESEPFAEEVGSEARLVDLRRLHRYC